MNMNSNTRTELFDRVGKQRAERVGDEQVHKCLIEFAVDEADEWALVAHLCSWRSSLRAPGLCAFTR